MWAAIFPGEVTRGGSPRGAEDREEALVRSEPPLRSLEYRAYLIVLCVGAIAASLSWLSTELGQPGGGFDRTAYLLMAILCAVLAALLWWGKAKALWFVGPVGYAGAAAFLLAKTYQVLYAGNGGPGAAVGLWEVSSWSPVLIFGAFLVFGRRGGLVGSLLFYAALSGIAAPHAFSAGRSLEDANALAQLLLSNLVVITLMFGLARLAEDHVRTLASEEAKERLAHTDFLTGIPNRRRLYAALEEEIQKTSRYDRPFSVILLDLDRFKEVNDSLGHEVGDRVLKELVRLIGGVLRETDRLGRWGGEEFLVLAPETDLGRALHSAARLRRVIEDHRFEAPRNVTASFGVATYQQGDTPESLLKRADTALYRAKKRGRNRVEAA